MAAATLDAASQTGAFSIMTTSSTTNLVHEWRGVIFSNQSRFCLQQQDGRIRVWWHRGELTLAACIRHHHTGPSPGMMTWGVIRYTSRSLPVRIDGTLSSARYLSGVLRPVAPLCIQVLRNPTFKHDCMLSVLYGPSLIPKMFDCCPRLSSDFSPIENVCSMVAKLLARHHTPVTTVDKLWYRVEAAWSSVPVHAIKSLSDSMPRHISAIISARSCCFRY
ncbi:odorant receptor [Trichonephila clavipes]|nr:odorant receptor [Trichonephila clavipes]